MASLYQFNAAELRPSEVSGRKIGAVSLREGELGADGFRRGGQFSVPPFFFFFHFCTFASGLFPLCSVPIARRTRRRAAAVSACLHLVGCEKRQKIG